MKARGMRGIDRAFQRLRPIARGVHLDDADLRLGARRPGRRLPFPHRLARPHIDPDEAAAFMRWIGLVLDMRLHARAVVGLARHVEDVAVHIELPAVIEAAEAAFLVAPESERGLAMRATLAEHAEPPVR